MTQLNQIIAIERGVKSRAEEVLTETHRELAKSILLSGFSRTYTPRDDEGVQLPPESNRLQVKTNDAIATVSVALTRMLDVIATKDAANNIAAADVVVDGVTLLRQVPAVTLIALEKQLVNLHTFISKLPVLDPAESWTYSQEAGAYATAPSQTIRSKKVMKNHVRAEATEKHPAQVDVYTEDIPEGTWTTIKYSGALPADRVAELLTRVTKLSEAVVQAREAANGIEVVDQKIGEPFFAYLFGA